MSNEIFASSTAGDDKDNNLVVPLVVKDPSAAKIIPVEPFSNGLEVTEDTECGIGFIRGKLLQRFATKNVYVFVYGLLGCVFSASYAYSNGTITTLEKRFKIPSKTIGKLEQSTKRIFRPETKDSASAQGSLQVPFSHLKSLHLALYSNASSSKDSSKGLVKFN